MKDIKWHSHALHTARSAGCDKKSVRLPLHFFSFPRIIYLPVG
jgi:hypothetical protein